MNEKKMTQRDKTSPESRVMISESRLLTDLSSAISD